MSEYHQTHIIKDGSGMDEKHTPACTCGWIGRGYEAHNDWQYTLVDEQLREHLAINHTPINATTYRIAS